MERPIKKEFMKGANQFTFDEHLSKYYATLELYATHLELIHRQYEDNLNAYLKFRKDRINKNKKNGISK